MNLCVFYHAKISGEGIPDPDFAFLVLVEQMQALRASGLAEAANEIYVGVNGDESDAMAVASLAPGKSQFQVHGHAARTEIPTMEMIRRWLPGRQGWAVLYHHTKGVTHPREVSYEIWRRRMESACVWNWRECVQDLDAGHDAVGCHWLTPQRFPHAVTSPYFGGTFWWAKSSYLQQLPPLPAPTWENRFEAESWIGRRRPYPWVRDYSPGWP